MSRLTSSKKERSLHIRFKDYVLKNLQALYRSSKVEFETCKPKNGFSNFLDFLYLVWFSRYKSTIERDFSINGETLVAVERMMFKFEDLKVNSRDDKQTDSQNEKHKVRTLAAL